MSKYKCFNSEWDLDNIHFQIVSSTSAVIYFNAKGSSKDYTEEVSVSLWNILTGYSIRKKTVERINELRDELRRENEKFREALAKKTAETPSPKVTAKPSYSRTEKQENDVLGSRYERKQARDNEDITFITTATYIDNSPTIIINSDDDCNKRSYYSDEPSRETSSSNTSGHSSSNHSSSSDHSSHSSSYGSHSSYDSGSSYSSSDSGSSSSSSD